MKLNDATIKSTLKAGTTLKQLTDGRGLYLKLAPSGVHSWRLDYAVKGKRSTITLGVYGSLADQLTLAQARAKAEEARKLIAQDIDPADARKQSKAENDAAAEERARMKAGLAGTGTFRHVAELLLEDKADQGAWGPSYTGGFTRDLKLRLLPVIGDRKCSELRTPDFVALAKALIKGETEVNGVAKRDHAGAKRALVAAETVMGYAVLHGYSEQNPVSAMGKLVKVIGPKVNDTVHRAAQTTPEGIKRVMNVLDRAPTPQVSVLTWVQAETAQRPRNVSAMEWAHLQLDHEAGPQWVIPANLMKRTADKKKVTAAPHYVPLSRQTVDRLLAQRAFQEKAGIKSPFVFSNRSDDAKPMGRDTLNETMRKLGIAEEEHTPHGFRATFRSLGQKIGIPAEQLEAHLAHVKGSVLEAAATAGMGDTYFRETFVEERRVAVQVWADYLQKVCNAPVLTLVPAAPVEQLAAAA